MNRFFSISRLWAMMIKEFIQMRRDRMTFAIILGIPVLQLILFGYAINTNPKHLPATVVIQEKSPLISEFVARLQASRYFELSQPAHSLQQAQRWLDEGRVMFVIRFEKDFSKKLIKGQRPKILMTTDATDPVAVSYASSAFDAVASEVFSDDLPGSLSYLKPGENPVQLIIHNRYNPELYSQYNIVPGLIGVILTMTLVIVTSQALTRERERGTMEHLLVTPVRPLEVMLGKILPYVILGYAQVLLVLVFAYFLFDVPVRGSVGLLLLCVLPFVIANLAVGMMFSSVARNQLQAMQMAFFFFLPSLLLSGFMFPFRGMPEWAQMLGEVLPLTHFVRIVRGIMLKGNTLPLVWPEIWPILLFMLVALFFALLRYRRTLD
ncbi:ABC transporter permease [Dongshaea marina]|uniref:ABC transporter permease n=1 Tax=Dongshaea marina TaxID=2047966 RepID=UPI000D3EA4C7|nr:ABC transporter permease [Dongshaea marina]